MDFYARKEESMKKYWYHIWCLALAIGTSMGLLMTQDIKHIFVITRHRTESLPLFIVGIFFFWFYEKFLHHKYKNRVFQFLALLFSFFLVFGYSYDVVGDASIVNHSIWHVLVSIAKFMSFYHMFVIAITLAYEKITTYKWKEKVTNSKINKMFMSHPFLFSWIVILLCYLPYLILFYPGVMCNDPSNQIREVMGMHTRYMDSVILLDPNVTITNFNPILHTLLVGGCFKLGYTIGNVNLGLFLYTIIQTLIMTCVFAFAISYMKKEGVPRLFLWITLIIFAVVPVFPFYAVATNKDTIFSAFIILYVIQLYDVIRHDATSKKFILLFITSLLVILLRNNGIYTILLSLPFLLIAEKEKRKGILTVLCLLIVCYTGYNKVLLPSLKISNTSIREVLSIPFQQTARVVKKHGQEIPEDERKIIDYLLDFDTLGTRYDPVLSDNVKNKYNKYATTEDLMKYFQVWLKQFFRYPVDYFDATIANVYGYFYPNTSKWYIYYGYNTKLEEAGFDYQYAFSLEDQKKLTDYGEAYPYIPIIGMLVNIGFVVWIYFTMFGMLLVNKKGKYLPVLLPAFSLILVCVASPANTYFRYAQPYIFALPITMFLLYQILTKEKKKSSL